jgi:hypothetical protein
MRFLMIAAAATLLMLPAAGQANACDAGKAQAAATDYSAATVKKKVAKRHVKQTKEKVEYMRAAPMN